MTSTGEPVQPWLLPGLQRVARWQRGHTGHHAAAHVTLGQAGDGRWIAEHTDLNVGSYAHPTREQAERQITEWMWHGQWVEVPATYQADGTPHGHGWVRHGSQWVRDER
ncbi:hypothetical protein AB0B63_06990 [Micromonospora sp. NPDC049081]|uniref:hypothetical protein n=1 Tax=Micromonospora sp. NPDC049081 TaxID=3155150 RepID=UPI0033F88931